MQFPAHRVGDCPTSVANLLVTQFLIGHEQQQEPVFTADKASFWIRWPVP